jgi:8-oxo-dGTP pyrophosphatase MutT (NUDIX family)
MKQLTEKGGIAIINKKENKILLVKEKTGKWGLPKGRLEQKDPNIFACAVRELKEETGIDISRLNFYLRQSKKIAETTIYFIDIKIQTLSLKISIDPNEITEYIWHNIPDIKSACINKDLFNKTIRDFVRYF